MSHARKTREWRKPEKFFVWFRDQFWLIILLQHPQFHQRAQLIESCALASGFKMCDKTHHRRKKSFSKNASWNTKCKCATILIWMKREREKKRENAIKNSIQSIFKWREKGKKHAMQINCSKTRLATFDHKWQYQPINRYTINTNAEMLKESREKNVLYSHGAIYMSSTSQHITHVFGSPFVSPLVRLVHGWQTKINK